MKNDDDILHPCGRCAFYSQSIWRPVVDRPLRTLTRNFTRVDLDEGQTLFEQGSQGDAVYCVSKGLIALRIHDVDGGSILLRLAYPGEIVGFRSFLGNGVHQTTAQALLSSQVCAVPNRSARPIVENNGSVLARLTARCVEEIDRNHARIISTATLSTKQRLADLLRRLMRKHGKRVGDRIQMRSPLSRKDLADLLCVQRETLSRIVGRLEKDGIFTFKGREITMAPENMPARAS